MASQAQVYRTQGGAGLVVDSAGTITVKSGGTIALESGADITHDGTSLVDEIAAMSGMDTSEFGYINGTVPGAGSTATKAVVLDANRAFVFYPKSTLGTDNAAGILISSPNSAESFFQNTDNDKRSYLLRVQAYRPSTLPMGDGVHGVDDAAAFIYYRSYAADTSICIQRGLNASINHRGTSAGSIGNLISTNASTSTTLAGDNVALTCINENYAPATGGVSGVLDLVYLHEGPNATTSEFGLRIRNQKKNGSATGAYIYLDDSTSTTALAYGIDMSAAVCGTAEIRLTNSMVIKSVSTAISDNDSTTLPASSLVVTSNNTGKGTLFISDGSNLQAIALA